MSQNCARDQDQDQDRGRMSRWQRMPLPGDAMARSRGYFLPGHNNATGRWKMACSGGVVCLRACVHNAFRERDDDICYHLGTGGCQTYWTSGLQAISLVIHSNVQPFKNSESMVQVHVHAHGRCPKCQAFKLSRTDMIGEAV